MKHGTVIRVMVPGQRWRYVRWTPNEERGIRLVPSKEFASYFADWSEAQDVAENLPDYMKFDPGGRTVVTDGKEWEAPLQQVYTTDVEIITILRIERSER